MSVKRSVGLSFSLVVFGLKREEIGKVCGFVDSHILEINHLKVLYSSKDDGLGRVNVTVDVCADEAGQPGSSCDLFAVFHALSVSLFRGRRGANAIYNKQTLSPCKYLYTAEKMYGFQKIELCGVNVALSKE
jgi:hypothetical protein